MAINLNRKDVAMTVQTGDLIYIGRDEFHAHWGYWEKEVREATMSENVAAYRVDRDSTPEMVAHSINPTSEVYELAFADGRHVPFAVAW